MNLPRMLLAGLVLAYSTVSVRADVWTFETPSENIQCTVGQDAGVQSDITCTIIERSGSYALPRPRDCSSDWGHTFSMREWGPAEVLCTPTSRSRSGYQRAEYGVTGEFGGFVCASSTKGLKCSNRDGNGFFLSRKVQSVFYGTGTDGSSKDFGSVGPKQGGVLAPEVMNKPYAAARSVIMDQGWWPLDNFDPGNLVFVARDLYDQGYIEVDTCSPVGDAPCKFYFYKGDQYLEISTRGEHPLVAGIEILDVRAVEARRAASTPEAGAYTEPGNISIACNKNGAVISLQDRSKVYLGNQCDAHRPGVGHGGWWLSASAFLVEIDGQTTSYANDFSCQALPYCDYRTARAQIDKAPQTAGDPTAQTRTGANGQWVFLADQSIGEASVQNGAGEKISLSCASNASNNRGSSITFQIGGGPLVAGTSLELHIENAYPSIIPLSLNRENQFVVDDARWIQDTFKTMIEGLKAGSSVTIRGQGGMEAKFSLKGSSAAIANCEAAPASELLSASAQPLPTAEQAVAQKKSVRQSPQEALVDANADLVHSEATPDYRFVTLDGHAIILETQVESIAGTIQPWITWTSINFPTALPQLIEPELPGRGPNRADIYAIAAAHFFLSDAEKSAVESKLGLPFPLFAKLDGLTSHKLRAIGGYEGAATAHANLLVNSRDKLDEFTRGPALQEIRTVLRARLAASDPQLPLPVVRLYEVGLGEYDFENGGFPVEKNLRADNPKDSRISAIVRDMNRDLASRINSDVMAFPEFIPMEPEAAKRLIEAIAEYRKDRHRIVNMAVFGEMTEIRPAAEHRGSFNIELSHKVKRIAFGFGDDLLGDVFYSMVPDKLEDSEVEAVRNDGRTKLATLYGPEYLASAVSDAFPDFVNAPDTLETLMRARVSIENADLASWGLGSLPADRILRPELAAPKAQPNEDDIRLYRAFLDGRRQAGIGSTIVLPVSTWVRQTDSGNKAIEHERPIDLVAHAISQNMALFGRLRGSRDPRSALAKSAYTEEPGRILLPAGNLNVDRRTWSPVLFSLKLDKTNPNAPLDLRNGLAEPATTHGGETQLADPRIDGELRGHLVLELEEAPIVVEGLKGSGISKAVVFKVALKQILLLDQGRELTFAFTGGQDVKDGDGALPSVPTPETLPLDAETSDLLILRHLTDTVTDDDYKRMLLARWEIERRQRDINSEIAWGRFFKIGQPKPEGGALDAILPAFRDWSKARAANLPETLMMTPRGFPLGEPRIAGFGNTLANPNALRGGLMSCETAVRVGKGQTNFPEHKLTMLENACEYIRQAANLPSNVLYMGRTESLPAKWRGKGTSPLAPARHGTVGLRSECTDRYCRSVQKEIQNGSFGQTVFKLDDVYLFDKAADLRPEIVARARGGKAYVRLAVKVAGIERSTEARPSPLARALMKVDQFLVEEDLLERNALADWAPELVETNFFDIRVVGMELVERTTDTVLASVPLVDVPATADERLLQPVERVTVSAPSEAYGRDIVGLRLGMSFEEADQVIRQHMKVGRTYTADRSWSVRAAAGTIDPFSSGIAYESEDGGEVIIVHDEPPSASKVVVGAVRQLVFEKNKVRPDQIFSQAREKYGAPDFTEGDSQAWVEHDQTNVNCMAFSAAQQSRAIWRDADGSEINWMPGTFRGGGAPAPMITERHRLDYISKCGHGVTVTFDTRENRNWDRLVFRLHDAQTLFKHITQSEILIQEGASFGKEPATDGEKTEIKF